MITDAQLNKMSSLQAHLLNNLRACGLPEPEVEYMFAKQELNRKWRFDFAWVEKRIGVEVDGGTWSGGRHTRGAGFEADCEKLNAASELGWEVYRYTSGMIERGDAVAQLARVLYPYVEAV